MPNPDPQILYLGSNSYWGAVCFFGSPVFGVLFRESKGTSKCILGVCLKPEEPPIENCDFPPVPPSNNCFYHPKAVVGGCWQVVYGPFEFVFFFPVLFVWGRGVAALQPRQI